MVRITGRGKAGDARMSRQLRYVAEGVNRVFLSQAVCKDMGIVAENFPKIGAYPQAELNSSDEKIEKENKAGCTGLETGTCDCPRRELPPPVPETCPFPPTKENVPKLEKWLKECY